MTSAWVCHSILTTSSAIWRSLILVFVIVDRWRRPLLGKENAYEATAHGKETALESNMILSLESQAPAIKVQNWLRGEALANFQPKHVYVLEFFGTSCPHCVKAMPNLIHLQEKYRARGLEVVGVAASEKAATADEAQANLEAWLTEKSPKSNFRIGLDCTGEMGKPLDDTELFFPHSDHVCGRPRQPHRLYRSSDGPR